MSTPDRAMCAQAAEICACFNFRRTARAVTRYYDEMLLESGLRSTQFLVLVAIGAHDAPTLPRLARYLDLDRSAVTRALKPLERKRWVRLHKSASGRASTVSLTKPGSAKLNECLPLWERAQAGLVESIGKRKFGSLIEDLSAVNRAAGES